MDIELVEGTYQIYTAKGLAAFGDLVTGTKVHTADVNTNSTITDWTKDVDANAMLMKDIDLSTICYPASDGVEAVSWAPIGGSGATYAGTFDGNNKKISNLYATGVSNIALFGYTTGDAVIKNLIMENPCVEATATIAAAIVGRTGGTRIENCHVTGAAAKISGMQCLGAIVGTLSTGTVTGCTNYATIVSEGGTNGTRGCGGIVGLNAGGADGLIENCVNYGAVSGTINIGGVVGYVKGGSIQSCSNEGTVTNTGNNTGGIVGSNAGGNVTGAVSPMSYNSGVVTGTGNVGGIVGNNTGAITNYENRGQFVSTTEAETVGGIVGISTGTVGDECEDNYTGAVVVAVDIKSVDGTYEIYTAKGLEAFATIVNAGLSADAVAALSTDDTITEEVAQNAAANGTVKANIALENAWTPMAAYAGTFDGGSDNGYAISGLTGANGLLSTAALGATVQNVNLVDINITCAANNVGGIVGAAAGMKILDCNVSGVINNSSDVGISNVAGVVGLVSGDNFIINTHNSATVSSTAGSAHSGIVGKQGSGTVNIIGCSNSGNISNTGGYATGMLSWQQSGTANIIACSNAGGINGAGGNNLGGMCGRMQATTNLTACYSTGFVTSTRTGSNGFAGAIAAGNSSTTTYTNNYAIYTPSITETANPVNWAIGTKGAYPGTAGSEAGINTENQAEMVADVATLNGKVEDMNTALTAAYTTLSIDAAYQYKWVAGGDSATPTLIKVE